MRLIGGKHKGAKLYPPTSTETRPTSDKRREMIFNILLHNPQLGVFSLEEKKVLDVFAGTGALGLEAFSRGAETVFFIENHRRALTGLYENLKKFGLPPTNVLKKDALGVGNAPFPFDLIFLDPPYSQGLSEKALQSLLLKGWLSSEVVVVVEDAKDTPFIPPPGLETCLVRFDGISALYFCKRTLALQEN